MKVELIGEMLKKNISLNPADLKFGYDATADAFLQKFSDDKKYRFYSELGKSLAQVKDLSLSAEMTTTYYDLSAAAFDHAIEVKTDDPSAYQGKYLIQARSGFFSDMIITIKSFFERNVNISNEKTIKTFLSDWTTAVEKLTGFPRDIEAKYIQTLKENQLYRQKWDNLFEMLKKYRPFYIQGTTSLDVRLKKALSNAEKYRRINNEGG